MKRDHRPEKSLLAPLGAAALLAATVVACFGARGAGGGDIEARYATVHNAFSAMGLSEVGALHDAHVASGQETNLDLELSSGCTTIVAIGGATLEDVQAQLVEPSGIRIARGTAHTSEATLRACVEKAGRYTLKLGAARGQGSLLVSTWSGGAPGMPGGSGSSAGDGGLARGSCDAPIPVTAGDYGGTTARAESRNDSKSCSPGSGAPEVVYRLDLTSREKVTVALETLPSPDDPKAKPFDSILYLRKGDCTDVDAEVTCNDDASPTPGAPHDQQHSRIVSVLDPGTYFIFVDGYGGKSGPYSMHVDIADVPPLSEVCSQARVLASGVAVTGSLDAAFDMVSAKCGDGAHGADEVFSLPIEQKSRVRLHEHSDDVKPVVHIRSQCEDPQTERGCAADDTDAVYVGLLDPGPYSVFADSSVTETGGKYTLTADVTSARGAGVHGDRCADALPLVVTDPEVNGDTFDAHDDVSGSCGGTGAPDVVYRLDLATRTRFNAHFTHEEASHVMILLRGCTGPKQELACGKGIDRVLAPGAYFLAIDGESPEGFGAFTLQWTARDTLGQDAACRSPALLREGDTVGGSTSVAGATDKFSPSCAGSDAGGGAADMVYKLVVPTRKRVHLRMHAAGWPGVLSVRRACAEGATAAAAEVECHAEDTPDLDFDSLLDPGTYYVVVDGKDASAAGAYTLQYLAPGR